MVPETAETTETKSTELTDEEKAAITAEIEKLEAEMGAGFSESGVGFFSSPEGIKISKAIERLRAGKKAKKAADPRKAEVKEALPAILEAQATRLKEQLVTSLVEKFPYLAELEGFTIDVKLKAKGIGRTGSSEGKEKAHVGRPLMRCKKTMKRISNSTDPRYIRSDALPGVNNLCKNYPDQADEIREIFGTPEKRNDLWHSISSQEKYTEIVHMELPGVESPDGSITEPTVLCLQK